MPSMEPLRDTSFQYVGFGKADYDKKTQRYLTFSILLGVLIGCLSLWLYWDYRGELPDVRGTEHAWLVGQTFPLVSFFVFGMSASLGAIVIFYTRTLVIELKYAIRCQGYKRSNQASDHSDTGDI